MMRNKNSLTKNNEQDHESSAVFRSVVGASALTMSLLGGAIAMAPATADVPTFNIPGTGGGLPGVGFNPGHVETYPALEPVIDDMPKSVRMGVQNVTETVMSAPSNVNLGGYSQGSIVAREAAADPIVSKKIDHLTLVGDPCSPSGILKRPDIVGLAHMACPVDNPLIPKTIVSNNQDPIGTAGAHTPQNLLDWANSLAGFEVAHTYNLPSNTYEKYVRHEGSTTYVDYVMHDTALKVALARRGIFITRAQEQAIINAIPEPFRPEPVAPTSPARVVPVQRKTINPPVRVSESYGVPIKQSLVSAKSTPKHHLPAPDPIRAAVKNTAAAAERALPQFKNQIRDIEKFLNTQLARR